MIINLLGFAPQKLKKICKQTSVDTLKLLKTPCVELTIKFVSKKEIRRLNREFRQIDKVTDVLSFPATNNKAGEAVDGGDGIYLGDMALCLTRAKQQAKQYNNTFVDEVKKLVVHSILHLLGYDHIEDSDYAVMNAKEQEIFSNLNKGENHGF